MSEEFGVWVYGVTRDPPPRLTEVTGVSGGALRAVAHAGLAALVSSVDLGEYGEQALRVHLEDLSWLEATARAHHAVVGAVAHSGPVAPMRLATVYRDEARVAEMLAEQHDELLAALRRITGRVEFGVKAYLARSVEPAETAPAPAGGASGPGAAYLQRRRADLSARDQGRQAAETSAQQVHAALSGLAEAARRHAPQHPRLSGERDPMLLNGAYLVEAEQVDGFVAKARALADRHGALRVELTGPWPPYSFAAVESAP